MSSVQPGILPDALRHGRYLTFRLSPEAGPASIRSAIESLEVDESLVVGLGHTTVRRLGTQLTGLRAFPAMSGPEVEIPSTQQALWCWIRGTDRGELVHAGRKVRHALAPAFTPEQMIDGFQYGGRDGHLPRDLTGYEDGTENPEDDAAVEAAVLSGAGPGYDGSSFLAVQQWVHDLERFSAMGRAEQDHTIGRRHADNEEIDDAPESAHVKRTAQETFEPEAFLLRRSMPWADVRGEGLVFTAFGRSFDAFEAILTRMAGLEDGIADALFKFSRPVTGGYYWCPPVDGTRLDLTALGS